MKYSFAKLVNKKELAELFLMLSDSIEESIPDIAWEGAEFEFDIPQIDINCDVKGISTKKGGEFTLKLGWITLEAKKEKEKEAIEKTKEKLKKGEAAAKGATTPIGMKKKKVADAEVAETEVEKDTWEDEDEENFDASEEDDWE